MRVGHCSLPEDLTRRERARGVVRISVRGDGGRSCLKENYQSGSARVRFPRHSDGEPLEAVLINTAGGLTGGDHFNLSVAADAGAKVVVSTQAAERIYRRSGGVATVENGLTVGAGASLDWLPQETIVFDRSALSRTLVADVDPSARLLTVEAIVLGRAAMRETAKDVVLSDTWRIRRGGKLLFADGLRLDGDATGIMAGGATGNDANALATLVFVAPDAEVRIDGTRRLLASCSTETGVSAWNGMLVARLLSPAWQALRADLVRLIEYLRDAPMPRVWNC
jgi:urease accessory protein